MKRVATLFSMLAITLAASAQDVFRPQPEEWKELIEGGQFMDRIQPMPDGKLSSDCWGAQAVKPRFVDNGIETEDISFWGGNIIKGDDGKYHFFVSGWYENNPRGHMGWYDASKVFHAVCDNTIGPFEVVDTVGVGHNTDIRRLKDGSYMIYAINSDLGEQEECCVYYHSKSLSGPWTMHQFPFDLRGRAPFDGVGGTAGFNWLHNYTFVPREDGSMYMLNRGGMSFVSKDGTDTYMRITERSGFPLVNGRYEDPLVWKDNVQYNMIVNDWYGRVAFYSRSKDGINWVVEQGQAYAPGNLSVHKDGTNEDWYKYERVRVYQDEYGRATQINFAVVDTSKFHELPNDIYSSKNISLPLNKGMLLEMLTKRPIDNGTRDIVVKIKAEEGFNPQTEVDVNTLRFGDSDEVNFGRGAVPVKSENVGKDLVVTFEGKNSCIDIDEFAPKMLGKNKKGEMIFGYSRLPWVDYKPAILSPAVPEFKAGKLMVTIDNYGMSASKESFVTLSVYNKEGVETQIGSALVPVIKPYEAADVAINVCPEFKEKGLRTVVVKVISSSEKPQIFTTQLKF